MKLSFADFATLGVMLAVMFLFVIRGAYVFRRRVGRRSVAIASLGVGTTILLGSGVLAGYAAYHAKSFARTLNNPRPVPELSQDWGASGSIEDRTKYSRMLMEIAYIERGESGQYFDLRGKRVDFVPTHQDNLRRGAHLAYIRALEQDGWTLAVLAAISLGLWLAALALSWTSFASWLHTQELRYEGWRKAAK